MMHQVWILPSSRALVDNVSFPWEASYPTDPDYNAVGMCGIMRKLNS